MARAGGFGRGRAESKAPRSGGLRRSSAVGLRRSLALPPEGPVARPAPPAAPEGSGFCYGDALGPGRTLRGAGGSRVEGGYIVAGVK